MSMEKIAQYSLAYIAASSALNSRLMQEVNQHRANVKAAADKQEALCQHMVSAGVVPATQKTAALSLLGNHAQCMDLLKNAVDNIQKLQAVVTKTAAEKAAGDIGRPADARDGGASGSSRTASLTTPFVGQRTSLKKASDHALAAILSPPSR